MTLEEYKNCRRGDKLYYARIIPTFGYYEIHNVIMVSTYDNYCSATESKSKQSFLFFVKEDGICNLFIDRDEALQYLKEEKKKYKSVQVYTQDKENNEESE